MDSLDSGCDRKSPIEEIEDEIRWLRSMSISQSAQINALMETFTRIHERLVLKRLDQKPTARGKSEGAIFYEDLPAVIDQLKEDFQDGVCFGCNPRPNNFSAKTLMETFDRTIRFLYEAYREDYIHQFKKYPDLHYVVVIEPSPIGKLHFHSIIKCPPDFITHLKQKLQRKLGGCDIEYMDNPDGAVDYLFKSYNEESFKKYNGSNGKKAHVIKLSIWKPYYIIMDKPLQL